jgi:FtsP/CotA-like multicopper oxidase with cupredoxin domain
MTLTRRQVLAGLCSSPSTTSIGTGAPPRMLEARPAVIEVAGAPVRLMTYDGLFPGPVLRWREGERFGLQLVNRLPEPTNLHFHGLHVPPDGNADNVFVTVEPGQRFEHALTVPEGHGGLYWYHPHPHDRHLLAAQLWAGLSGAIVIESPLDHDPLLAACDEHVLLVRDLSIDDGQPTPARMLDWVRGRRGEHVLVNGAVRPRLPIRSATARLRIVNASNARYLLLGRADGAPLFLIAVDGRFIRAPTASADVLIPPAGRAELLVPVADAPLDLVLLPYNRGSVREPSQPEPLLTLVPDGTYRPLPLPGSLADVPALAPGMASGHRTIVMGSGIVSGAALHATHMPTAFTVPAGATERWEVHNVDVQDHVFHLHTWHFQVWRRNGEPAPFPAWRDTINLRPGERAEILIPFPDFRGRSLYHCHIAEHGDSGMMAVFDVA